MRRRDFIQLGFAAAFLPLPARAQSNVPIIGFLHGTDAQSSANLVAALKEGLAAAGYDVGRNVAIEYRWAEGNADRLPMLAAELVSKRVAMIVGPTVAALAAKSVTSSIPIVFVTSDNPVKIGLVASVNRPGANVTGVNFLGNEVGTKRLDLLREMVPATRYFGLLLNPGSPHGAAAVEEMRSAADKLGYRVEIRHLQSERDVQTAFAGLAERKVDASIVITDQLMRSFRDNLAQQASRYAIPTIYPLRDFVLAGGLVSYGASVSDAYRQVANYAARILKGEKAAELPVVQSAKFELSVNLKAAKAIGLTIPETLLIRADEVIA